MKSVLIKKIQDTEAIPFFSVLKEKGKVYTFLNPVSYLNALKHKDVFEQFDGIYADGSLLVASIRIIYGKRVSRRSCDMTSIGKLLLELSATEGKSLYLVASKQEEIEQAVAMFRATFKGVNIIGFRNGYFANKEEMNEEATHIVKLNPEFLLVGMGILKQEEFLLKVKRTGYQGIGFTCGGFIHQTANNDTNYYPTWIDKHNLRFFYRMYKEPYTIKRYAKAAIIFPIKFLAERLSYGK